MKDLLQIAVNAATLNGVDYADARIVETIGQDIKLRNGKLKNSSITSDLGIGVRVLKNGAWGFAATSSLLKDNILNTVNEAINIAEQSKRLMKNEITLTDEPSYKDEWIMPIKQDPFDVPIEDKLNWMYKVDEILRVKPEIKVASVSFSASKEIIHYADTNGSVISQTLFNTGAGYTAQVIDAENVQIRSFPSSFGGNYSGEGYELIEKLGLIENAEKIREETIMLTKADKCPEGKRDLIILPSQLALQIHESVGHPSELDRVMGSEESFAGKSFLTPEKLNNFQYASPIVNLIADGTLTNGLGTRKYDDDGVKSNKWNIVKDGMFVEYQTNREYASLLNFKQSSGNSRADGWKNFPLIRITNLYLQPGETDYEDLISQTDDGVIVDVNKSWSIDQLRYNFQFTCEIGWEVKNGKITRMLKHPSYQGITPQFWNSCDKVCSEKYFELYGVPNCGKGEPGQTSRMSHGGSPVRFKNINIF